MLAAACSSPSRASVCAGHESEVICMRNFLSREQALEARARLDATHAERMRSSTAPRWNRPAREDGSEFNQTEVLRLHSRYEPGLRSQLWHGAQRANSAGSWGYSTSYIFDVCMSWRRCQIPSTG